MGERATIRRSAGAGASVAALAEQVRPIALAEERTFAVLAPLAPLLPRAGLVRGSTVAVNGVGATCLSLALAAGASAGGSWVAVIGLPHLGLSAAAELGLALERLVVVDPVPAERWAATTAALAEAFDVVMSGPPRPGSGSSGSARGLECTESVPNRRDAATAGPLPAARRPAPRGSSPGMKVGDARRVAARQRERGAVLVQVGWDRGMWPERPDLELAVRPLGWDGIGDGHGHLQARRVVVEVSGRRGADRPRRAELWLPGPDGAVAPVADDHGADTSGTAATRTGAAGDGGAVPSPTLAVVRAG